LGNDKNRQGVECFYRRFNQINHSTQRAGLSGWGGKTMNSFEIPPQQPKSRTKILEGAGEKVSAYLKYKTLKIKEYFGQLNQEDFDQLLELDFQEQLKDTPPIKGIFSPEKELTKIRSLPREQKREALTTFKKLLARQREAWAACRVFIERSIEFNHNIPREKLIGLVNKFGAQYGFDDRQKQIAEQLIDGYFENRKKVLAIRQQIPDDYELVRELTGVNLDKNAKIYISIGPMTIDINADGATVEKLYHEISNKSSKIDGFAARSSDENHILYIVINQNKRTGVIKDTRKHEYEHQKNRLFRAVFERQEPRIELISHKDEQDPEIRKIIIEDFFDKYLQYALEFAKDEFIAYSCHRNLLTIQRQLWRDSFDYLQFYLRAGEKLTDYSPYLEIATSIFFKKFEIFTRITAEAFASYVELLKKGRYSIQEAIALLTDKSLTDWPKTVRRLLEQKK